MHSNNPVFRRTDEFKNGGYATFNGGDASPADLQDMYDAPAARPVGRMTLDDVIMRTGTLFAILVPVAAVTFVLKPSFLVIIGAGLVALVLGLVIQFSKTVRPALMMVYSAIEGVFVGGFSFIMASFVGDSNIIFQAILGTLCAFGAMLVAYRTGLIRNSPRFQKILTIAGLGYLAFSLIHFGGVMFGAWESIYFGSGGPSLLGIGLSLFGVGLASMFLVLDFDYIEKGIANRVPEQYAWVAAFGLMVTLVWIYLEILRLLAILRGSD